MVIISHAPELQDGDRGNEILSRIFGTLSFGEMAVDSFFILSGFLIVKSWQGRPDMIAFLTSRILRIYPGFIAASLLCAFAIGPVFSLGCYFNEFWFYGFIIGLAKLQLVVVPSAFPDTPYPSLNGSMWTIPYEFKCYLFVLLCGLTGVLNRRHIFLSLFMVCTVGYAISRTEVIYIPFDIYIRLAMVFTAGGCFYLYRNRIPWKLEVAWIALFLFFVLMFSKSFAEPALCIFWGYAIIYYANTGTTLLGFNRFPDISYGVYLYAWPINKIILWYFPTMNVYALMFSVFVVSVFAGAISWYVVEKPFMRLKKRFRQRSLQTA